jgi:hypothetical protein
MPKVSARWVTRQLLDISRYPLSCYKDELDFVYRIVTKVETWVHHFDPEFKVEAPWLTHSEEFQEGALSIENESFNFWG